MTEKDLYARKIRKERKKHCMHYHWSRGTGKTKDPSAQEHANVQGKGKTQRPRTHTYSRCCLGRGEPKDPIMERIGKGATQRPQ